MQDTFEMHWVLFVGLQVITFISVFLAVWFAVAWALVRKKARLIESILNALTDEQVIDSVKYVESLMRKTRYKATKS